MEEGEYESVLCVKPEVHVYRIPPRATNRGYRAAEWQLDQPSWSGRLRITAKGQVAYIKLEDRTSGELFAQAPVDQFPGTAVESVTDSSRYFVIRIEDGNGRRGSWCFLLLRRVSSASAKWPDHVLSARATGVHWNWLRGPR
uniref:NECAP endocytosis associated 2 n=1 Tax=Equus caballus TaxID=9796 RepID=F6QUV8_HORSE